jgi:hypothetical protein
MIDVCVTEDTASAVNLQLESQSSQSEQAKQSGPVKDQEVIDWAGMSNPSLWTTKVKGAAEEKVRRSYEAICLYNDTVATGDDDRLAITNQALRELSGVNGLVVGDWIKAHADEAYKPQQQVWNAEF